MTALVVTRTAAFGAAQLGLVICLVFLAAFGLVVLVGEQRRKARSRRLMANGSAAAGTARPPRR